MLINTSKGEMDTSLLYKKDGVVDNENEQTRWVEYWLDGELVHRSVHVTLKKAGVAANMLLGNFNGETLKGLLDG